MNSVAKVFLLCIILATAFAIRSDYIREEGIYLLGADPYYHYRMAETILTHGHRPEWDVMASWPTGQPVTYPPVFQYYLAYSFKAIGGPLGFDLFHWCIYAGMIPFSVCILLVYVIGALITNDYGGIFAASLFATMPTVTMRTVIGFTDTDTFVLLFSLVITLFFVLTVRKVKKLKNLPVPAFLCGFFLFLFSETWPGYWYMLPLLAASFLVFILHKREVYRIESLIAFLAGFCSFIALYGGAYLVGVLLLAIFFFYEGYIHVFVVQPKMHLHVIPGSILVLISVWITYSQGILSPAFHILPFTLAPESDILTYTYTQMIVDNFAMTPELAWQILGPALILAPLGLVVLLNRKVWLSAFLLFYLAGTALMLLRGGRFSVLMAIPLCLGTTLFVVELFNVLSKKQKVYTPGIAILCIIILAVQVVLSEKVNEGSRFMTDDLWTALCWIDETTPEDSVVIGHWGMGYLIEAIGRRRSVMNGSQYDLFWRLVKYSTILTTDSEEIAAKEIYGFDTASEIQGLRILSKNQKEARQQIAEEMTPFAENNAYLVIDEFTALTFGWWSQFGTWNYSHQSGRQFFYNMAFLTTGRKQGKTTEYKYQTRNNIIMLYKAEDGFHSYKLQGGQLLPTRGTIFYKEGKKFYFMREEGVYGIVFLPHSEEQHEEDPIFRHMCPYILGIPQSLEKMLLTSFYFLDGDGLTYFELVKEVDTVKVYRVHKIPQENLNEGVTKQADEFTLVATPA
ncbi:MAG: hypothetical protein AYK18_09650 [Theionarchaea archaeon DG-70]|nr:MAG: hypothetical protein AYK18_09650 [Theionarchaea archaeon DG-70]